MMEPNNKSQVSMEFALFVGLAMLLVFVLSLVQFSNTKEVYINREFEMVYDLALKLQEELRTASLMEDGYSRNFSIPPKLENIDYTLMQTNNILAIQSNNTVYTVRIPTITGAINKGSNLINKTGGVLYLNQ